MSKCVTATPSFGSGHSSFELWRSPITGPGLCVIRSSFHLLAPDALDVPSESDEPRNHGHPSRPHAREVAVRPGSKERKHVVRPFHETRPKEQGVREELGERPPEPQPDRSEQVQDGYREYDAPEKRGVAQRRDVERLPDRRSEPARELLVDVRVKSHHGGEMERQHPAAGEMEPARRDPERERQQIAGADHRHYREAKRPQTRHHEQRDEEQRRPYGWGGGTVEILSLQVAHRLPSMSPHTDHKVASA